MGFNLIRLPIAPQTLDPDNLQGRVPFLKNADPVIIENFRLALETVIRKLDAAGDSLFGLACFLIPTGPI